MRVNEILVAGHLGQDAKEVMAGSTRLVSFTLAYSEGKDDKKWTNWYTVKVWGNQGREWLCDIAKDFKKGDAVAVKGRLKADIFPRQDGTGGLSLEVQATWFAGPFVKAGQRPEVGEKTYAAADPPPTFSEDDLPF